MKTQIINTQIETQVDTQMNNQLESQSSRAYKSNREGRTITAPKKQYKEKEKRNIVKETKNAFKDASDVMSDVSDIFETLMIGLAVKLAGEGSSLKTQWKMVNVLGLVFIVIAAGIFFGTRLSFMLPYGLTTWGTIVAVLLGAFGLKSIYMSFTEQYYLSMGERGELDPEAGEMEAEFEADESEMDEE